MSNILIPVSLGFKGVVDIELKDTITGKIKEKRRINNLLLNEFHNRVLRDGASPSGMGFCFLGTSAQPAQRTDTGIIGTNLGKEDIGSNRTYSIGNPVLAKREYTFYAGTATGDIEEIYIDPHSRIVVTPAISKGNNDELKITYTRYCYREADSWSGTIASGQNDGITDINWIATINNNQLKNVLMWGFRVWFQETSSLPDGLRIGNSNAASDLINDGEHTIKGAELFRGRPCFLTRDTYSLSRNYRDIRFGLETDEANGQIGEIIIPSFGDYGLMRITFDPPLNKTIDYRLYITFRFGLASW